MPVKRLLTVLLAAFVMVALVFIAKDARAPKEAAPAQGAAGKSRVTSPRSAPQERAPAAEAPARPITASVSGTPADHARPKPAASVTREPSHPAVAAEPGAMREMEAGRPAHARKIVATYFHGNIRCPTCRKVEAYAREAVQEGFGSQIARGAVEFRAVNVEEPGNRHFIDDFQLLTKTVVVTDELDGAVVRYVKLDNVWGLVGNRGAYCNYVQDAVRGYLETP